MFKFHEKWIRHKKNQNPTSAQNQQQTKPHQRIGIRLHVGFSELEFGRIRDTPSPQKFPFYFVPEASSSIFFPTTPHVRGPRFLFYTPVFFILPVRVLLFPLRVWVCVLFLPYIRRRFMVSSRDEKLAESSLFEGPVPSDKWMIPWIWAGFTKNQSLWCLLHILSWVVGRVCFDGRRV